MEQISRSVGTTADLLLEAERAVARIDQDTQANAAAAERIVRASQALEAHVDKLEALLGRFRLGTGSAMAAEFAPRPAARLRRPTR